MNGSDIADAVLDGDDSTDPFAMLAGKTSCHTGWLKSAGMLMPMGYLIKNGYVTPVGDTSDINSLRIQLTITLMVLQAMVTLHQFRIPEHYTLVTVERLNV